MTFKELVRSKAKEVALETLNKMKKKLSKMDNIFYLDLEIQDYLKDRRLKTSLAKAVFKFKTRMANLSENFKEGAKPNNVHCGRNQMLKILRGKI